MTNESALEARLASMLSINGIPDPEREYRPLPQRRWRFDFAWPDKLLAIEVEGGVWAGGRHTRGAGFITDCEKYNTLTLSGWRVLRITGIHIDDGSAIQWIWRGLGLRQGDEPAPENW